MGTSTSPSIKKIINRLQKKTASAKCRVLFLDFDGTLSPIVRRPYLATMSPRFRKQILRLAQHPKWTVGIVSGRDLKTVMAKVRIPRIIYAGNHGYEILIPGRKKIVYPAARATKPLIHRLCQTLRKNLKKIPGALVENKGYSASLHTRTLSPANGKKAHKIFMEAIRQDAKRKRIAVTKGKKVLEIRPPGQWNKGKAVLAILKKLKLPAFPIYIGDDKTDEDAFGALRRNGFGIRVGKKGPTAAHASLASIRDIHPLLRAFATLIG